MTFDVARPAPAPFGFAGADTDSTGMIYLIGRYYDLNTYESGSSIGRELGFGNEVDVSSRKGRSRRIN